MTLCCGSLPAWTCGCYQTPDRANDHYSVVQSTKERLWNIVSEQWKIQVAKKWVISWQMIVLHCCGWRCFVEASEALIATGTIGRFPRSSHWLWAFLVRHHVFFVLSQSLFWVLLHSGKWSRLLSPKEVFVLQWYRKLYINHTMSARVSTSVRFQQ